MIVNSNHARKECRNKNDENKLNSEEEFQSIIKREKLEMN
jgi:hypothetical protein